MSVLALLMIGMAIGVVIGTVGMYIAIVIIFRGTFR